jgi:preprotein translocase subunit SecA
LFSGASPADAGAKGAIMGKTWILGLVAVSMLLVVGGCERTTDDVVDDTIEAMRDITETLEGVKDKESAEAAVDDLKEQFAHLKELSEEGEKLMEELSEEDKKALEDKYDEEMKEVGEKFMAQIMRVGMNPEIMAALKPAMDEMPK